MNKKFLPLIFLLGANSVFASYLWDINVGINEFLKGNYNYSKNYFTTYLKSNPNDENGYWWLGKTYQRLNDSENSILNFEKSYLSTFSKKELEKINFDPKEASNIEDYFDMAVEYYSRGNYKEADFYADMMLRLNKKSASAYFIKAKIAKTLKNDEEAKKYIEQAILFNNDILNTNLAKTLKIATVPVATKEMHKFNAIEFYYKGELKDSIANAKKYVELDKSIDMTNFLINLYIKNNDIEQAKALIEDTKNIGIANIQTYISESQTTQDENKKEKILKEAYKINPNNPDVLLNLGNLYLKKEDFENASKYFEILTLVDNEMYEAYFGYSFSLLKLNKTEEALNFIRKMHQKNPISSENLFLLSLVAQNQQSYLEAIEYLDEALKKDENASYYFEKAKIYFDIKNYQKSLENLKLVSKTTNSFINEKKVEEYFIKNYLKLNMPNEAQNLLSYNTKLDKNRIMYKYYLYNLCKLQGNNSKTCEKTFKLPKPMTLSDYIDISEILLDKNNLKEASKIVETGLKKYPNSSDLLQTKNKIDYYQKQH